MADTKNILIIGGGYGGIAAARKLAKRYQYNRIVTITLIDRHPFHTLMTELHEVAGSRTEPDAVRVPYAKVFGASKVKVQIDNIITIDFEKKEARSMERSYPYDYLVLGTGAEPEYFGIPGIRENSLTLWSFDDAMKLRRHLEDTFEKAVAEPERSRREDMLSFVVAGAGFTGIELTGELLEWRDSMCDRWLVPKSEVRITVVEALGTILPMLEEDLREKAEYYLKQHGVKILTNSPIVGAEPGLVKLKDGSSLGTGTFIWTAGVSGNSFADSLDISKGPFGKNIPAPEPNGPPKPPARNRKGRLLTNDEIRSVDYPNVFPVGDNLWFTEEGKPLPQIVETAVQTGQTAAANIIASIEGSSPRKFKSKYHGFMVSLGGKYAVSNAMGIKLSGIFAMGMKHLVNLHYLFSVAGINQCWEYLKHEFLNNDTGRTFVRGFGSYRSRAYWLLPLRLWVGLLWVFEGINKIGEGYFAWSSGSKSGWMFSRGVVQNSFAKAVSTAGEAVDTVSAASGAASEAVGEVAVEAISDAATGAAGAAAGAVALVTDVVSAASGAAGEAVTDTAAAVTTEVVDAGRRTFKVVWDITKPVFDANGPIATCFREFFMDKLMAHIPFELFQMSIVLAEIAIGLAMISGLFTWWAAIASMLMCLVFTMSGMFRWDQVWFFFTGFLLLGGAGRGFGLDCWVVPAFKKWWNGLRFVRRHHWYLDDPSR
jgi:NADH dehydrogenase